MLVVGAGPAGAFLAGALARQNVDVLLVDRLVDLRQAAFSSAALPRAAIEHFGLPASVQAAQWCGWQLVGPGGSRRRWDAPAALGAVLDFGELRHWLTERAQSYGARLQLGCTALSCQQLPAGGMLTALRDPGGRTSALHSDWVVDASGEARALLGDPPDQALVSGVGVEWLLEVEQDCWQLWRDRLSFFIGSDWVPQGYGWIFPMAPGQLKLGVCRLVDPRRNQPPLARALQGLLRHTGLVDATVLDRHGGRIRSSIRRRERHGRGRLLAIGDAVSTANLLGGEGIRHALLSAEVLAPWLAQAARSGPGSRRWLTRQPLKRYERELRAALGWRWSLSGRLALRTWMGLVDHRGDARLEGLLSGLEACSASDLSALLFDYRFERYGTRALPYLLGWRQS
ncbi:MAG: NAD(P)/FAD-dependent oxidoreductase [Cyanobacteriota bacterium]|nr:NAD(P)/FAD-dependent oxidoreductase [Cyanobacteriota bacterium]